ncbi:hypothetical protein ACFL96_15570 [Thermoproteota archaeon]
MQRAIALKTGGISMFTSILWVVGVIILIALMIVIAIGIIKTIIKVAFSLLGIAAVVWLILFLLNTRIF